MFKLKELPYETNALEPVISKELLELHYGKHHATYTKNFNIAIEEYGLEDKSLDEIFAHISDYPKEVENHGGGYFNHQFFWESMAPVGSDDTRMGERMVELINKSFGSFENLQKEFEKQAVSLFGSG